MLPSPSSSHSSSQINSPSSVEDQMLCPKLTLLGVALISEWMPAGFVWSRMTTAADPLLFLTSQLCFVPCVCCSSAWAYAEKVLPFLLALFLCCNCRMCSAWPRKPWFLLHHRNINRKVGQRTWSVFLYLPPYPPCFL